MNINSDVLDKDFDQACLSSSRRVSQIQGTAPARVAANSMRNAEKNARIQALNKHLTVSPTRAGLSLTAAAKVLALRQDLPKVLQGVSERVLRDYLAQIKKAGGAELAK